MCVCCCLVRFWCSSGGDVQLVSSHPRVQITSWTTQAVHLNACVCWSSGIKELTGPINSMFQLSSRQGDKSSMKVETYSYELSLLRPEHPVFRTHLYEFVAKVSPSSARKAFPKSSSCPLPVFCLNAAHISLTNQTVQKTLSRWCVEEKLQELWGVLGLFIQKSEISTWAWKRDPHSFWHHFLFPVQTNISFHEGLTHHLFLVSLVLHLPCHGHVHACGDVRAKRVIGFTGSALQSRQDWWFRSKLLAAAWHTSLGTSWNRKSHVYLLKPQFWQELKKTQKTPAATEQVYESNMKLWRHGSVASWYFSQLNHLLCLEKCYPACPWAFHLNATLDADSRHALLRSLPETHPLESSGWLHLQSALCFPRTRPTMALQHTCSLWASEDAETKGKRRWKIKLEA